MTDHPVPRLSRLDQALVDLLSQTRVATLATWDAALHNPLATLVPFAVAPGGTLVVHVSDLAAHTRHLRAHPAVSLLVAQADSADAEPLALPRVSLSGHAAFAAPDHVAPLRMAYLERLPSAAPLADFPDFHWVVIRVDRARHVQGFGAARNVEGDVLQAVLNASAKTSATSPRPRARRSR